MPQPSSDRFAAVLAFSLLLLPLAGCGGEGTDSMAEPMEEGPTEGELLARARDLQGRIITIDSHDDIPFDFGTDEVDPCQRLERQVDIPKMREGGLDVAFFIVYVDQTERTPEAYERAREQALTKFQGIHRAAEELCPDQIGLAFNPEDVERIVGEGKLAAAIGIENGFAIGRDLSLLELYSALGANYMTLAHGGHNDIADSATPEQELGDTASEHGGLSPFGEEVVAEMNRLGMMVDISHISKAAALHAIRISRAPVIASHSSIRMLADHPRNIDDETLHALADNGGVVQVVAFDGYLKVQPEKVEALRVLRSEFGIEEGGGRGGAPPDSLRSAYEERLAEIDQRWPRSTVRDFVDHIEYAVDIVGIEHVGISSDFDGGGGIDGWDDASETANVTAELIRRGYSDDQIAQLWGGNLLRVWSEAEQIALGEGAATER